MSTSKGNDPSQGCLKAVLFFAALGVLGWVFEESDKAGDLAGGLMKLIMFVGICAVVILYNQQKN